MQDMYPSIPAGSLPSCCELDPSDIRPDTPTSSIVDDVDWNEVSSLEDAWSQLDAVDRHLSRVDSYVSQLTHDRSCVLHDNSSAVRLMPAIISYSVPAIDIRHCHMPMVARAWVRVCSSICDIVCLSVCLCCQRKRLELSSPKFVPM